MRKRTVWTLPLCFAMVAALILSGCTSGAATTQPTQAASGKPAGEPTQEPTGPASAPWLQPFEETVHLTGVVGYDVDASVKAGTTPETNSILKLCKDLLNIDIEILWSVSSDQYKERLDLTLTSGNIPDLLLLESGDFYDFLNNGSLMDLTEAYNTYASNELKGNVVEAFGPEAREYSSKNGKLYAIPATLDPTEALCMLYYRADWLKKLNLAEPKTAEEMFGMFEAFANNDPDGNGKKDTVGVVAYDTPLSTTFGLQGAFQTFGAYPLKWIKDKDGAVVNGTVQNEMKVALNALAECYKNGGLAKDYATYNWDQAGEAVLSGKVGTLFGSYWIPNAQQMYGVLDEDPNCEWACMQLADSTAQGAGKALAIINDSPIVYFNCVSAKADKNAGAALVKILSMEMAGDGHSEFDKSAFNGLSGSENGWALFYTLVYVYYPCPYAIYHERVRDAIKTRDTSKLFTQGMVDWYEKSIAWLDDGMSGKAASANWGFYYSRVSNEGGIGKAKDIVAAGGYTVNVFYGEATKTEINVASTLQDMASTFCIDYIMGKKTEADWDAFVNDWLNLGGTKWTAEVNEQYKAIHQ